MNSKLKRIQNWPRLAQEANWSALTLAKQCGVSIRTLERYFLTKMNKSPKNWLAEQRQQKAVELLRDGNTAKEVSSYLGYSHPTNFSRQYKKHFGFCPVIQKIGLSSNWTVKSSRPESQGQAVYFKRNWAA